jgi:hypothetical protein
MTKFLEEGCFYMNLFTGSVSTSEEWENDFNDREDKDMDWEEWGGD